MTARSRFPRRISGRGHGGHRVQVVDYDASLDRYRKPKPPAAKDDPFKGKDPDRLIADPEFHAWNCYAIVMSTLARFEFALGRRVAWSFGGHQIKVAPHALRGCQRLLLAAGRVDPLRLLPGQKDTVFTCLSHDVISHETTHALLDGLRERYMDPSSADQAAFHEGFADVVALLSVFALPGVVERIVDLGEAAEQQTGGSAAPHPDQPADRGAALPRAPRAWASRWERRSRACAVRRSASRGRSSRRRSGIGTIRSSRSRTGGARSSSRRCCTRSSARGATASRRWARRPRRSSGKTLDRERVVEEGATLAETLLTTAIRALDYAPTVDLKFGDYLSAVLTGDREVRPDDKKYDLRRRLREAFASYGIRPAARTRRRGRLAARARGAALLWHPPRVAPAGPG